MEAQQQVVKEHQVSDEGTIEDKKRDKYLLTESYVAQRDAHRNFETYQQALSHKADIVCDAANGELYLGKDCSNIEYVTEALIRAAKAAEDILIEAVGWKKYFKGFNGFPLGSSQIEDAKDVYEKISAFDETLKERLEGIIDEDDIKKLGIEQLFF